jgi:hypothetical protein
LQVFIADHELNFRGTPLFEPALGSLHQSAANAHPCLIGIESKVVNPATIKELKAALAAYRDSQTVMIYEDADLSKLPPASQLRSAKRTVIVI